MKKKELDKDHKSSNSSMAENVEEMKNLGRQMENLRTNHQLKQDDKIPDPIQSNKNEENLR